MPTVTELLWTSLRNNRGLVSRTRVPDLDSLRETEGCPEFHRLRQNRLIMGGIRYGLFGDPRKPQYDRVASAHKRLEAYQQTGNTEHLLDVANMMELEWVEGQHPNKHFHAQDDSPHTEIKGDSNS